MRAKDEFGTLSVPMETFHQIVVYGCQILLLAVPLYYVAVFLNRTRGYRILFGILLFYLGMYLAAKWFAMDEIGWILDHAAPSIPLVLIILFQPELRRLFARLGGQRVARTTIGEAEAANVVTQLSKSVATLAAERVGAIIAIEQDESLDAFATGGRKLGAPVVGELINTIFYPGTPLHDGGVIIRAGTIAYAGCIFPLGTVEDRRRAFGTRHRAAIGLTEKSDAIVIVVSEETGLVSVAYRGDLLRGISQNALVRILQSSIGKKQSHDEASQSIRQAGEEAADPVAAAIADIRENS